MSYTTTWLQNNKATKGLYKFAKKIVNKNQFSVDSLNSIQCIKSENDTKRLNLVLPTVNKYKIFGGIATALKIYDMLAKQMDADLRIIVNRNEHYNPKYSLYKEGYSYNTVKGEKQFIFLADTDNCLTVRKNDIFLCTSWDTAYCMKNVIKWQKKIFMQDIKMLYLIQDFEPGFYAWSSQYMLADSTYRNDDIKVIAIFNSKELYEFFLQRQYQFYEMIYFPPRLNTELAEYLISKSEDHRRKKQILIYGRPGTERNAFAIISHALKLWAESYKNANEWEVISLGETFDDIKISDNKEIKCLGKATLEQYAQIMLESYIGISLMVSPHPSYPPLEMSTFGVKTITNKFENKDLQEFNKNIISINKCTPEVICKQIELLCEEYPNHITTIDTNSKYVMDTTVFQRVIDRVCNLLD